MLYPRGYGPLRLLLAVYFLNLPRVFVPDTWNHVRVHVPAWAAVGSGVYLYRFHVNFCAIPVAAMRAGVRLSPPWRAT